MKPIFLTLLLPLLAVSCNVLKPVEDTSISHLLEAAVPTSRAITGSTPAIAVSRPSLPSYLDRQQLVSRTSTGELKMNSYHLWAEPLDAGISRVTAANLSRLKNSLNIQPVENFVTLDYQSLLELRISRFEPDATGEVVLSCTWKLQPVAGKVAPTQSFTTNVPVAGPPVTTGPQTARIEAMNEALARLARAIARSPIPAASPPVAATSQPAS